VQAADTVERVVGVIRDKTAVPLTTAARALVYGLLVAVMGLTIAVFSTIAATRILTAYLFRGEVWASYLFLGGIFTGLGALLLRMASSAKTTKKGH
jgi:hypothetical protein